LIDDNSGKLGPPEEEHIKSFLKQKVLVQKEKFLKRLKIWISLLMIYWNYLINTIKETI
jgi:hypothetical protein